MPYIAVSVSSATVGSSISIAFGTLTSVAASTLTVTTYNDDGTIQTGNNTSIVVISQHGVGSVQIASSTLTVSAGTKTTSFRGYITGNLAILGKASGFKDGVAHVTVSAIEGSGAGTYFPTRTGGSGGGAGTSGGGGGGGAVLLRNTVKINGQTLYRVILWDVETTKRGRGNIKAIIHDAKAIGVSSYLNDAGEVFFTLPYNHPQIGEIKPLERHYRVDRFDEEAGQYRAIGQGLIEDYEATVDEVIVYGIDYMNVLNKTITTPSTTANTYTSKTFEFVYQDQMSQAINETGSRLGFIRSNAGTTWSYQGTKPLVINSSTNTYTLFTGGEPRMGFLSNLCNIVMEGTTNKVVFGNPLESETESYDSFFCDMKYRPIANDDVVLEYGGNVKSFTYSPNYRKLRTRFRMIAVNSTFGTGAITKIWSSAQTNTLTPIATYGVIEEIQVMENLMTQAQTDSRAAFQLYHSSPNFIRQFSVAVVDGSIIPFKRYKLGDDIRVRIKRGIVNVDANITLTGQRYIGNVDGSEQIFFDFILRGATQFDLYSKNPTIPTLPLATQMVASGLAVPASTIPSTQVAATSTPRVTTTSLAQKTGADEPTSVKS